MTILDDLLAQVKDSEFDEQVQQICNQISEEETPKAAHADILPKGPNIFLSVEVEPKVIGIPTFVCLEREYKESYIITMWMKREDQNTEEGTIEMPTRRVKIFPVNLENAKVRDILTKFAEVIQYTKGR